VSSLRFWFSVRWAIRGRRSYGIDPRT
jgi:hypothetical protein